jgi:hypothetical protein
VLRQVDGRQHAARVVVHRLVGQHHLECRLGAHRQAGVTGHARLAHQRIRERDGGRRIGPLLRQPRGHGLDNAIEVSASRRQSLFVRRWSFVVRRWSL